MYVCMHAYICIYVCMYVCKYVCMYIHTYTHTQTQSSKQALNKPILDHYERTEKGYFESICSMIYFLVCM